jgi:hypothetical protein
MTLLKNIVDRKEDVDMKRMGNVVKRRILESYDHVSAKKLKRNTGQQGFRQK